MDRGDDGFEADVGGKAVFGGALVVFDNRLVDVVLGFAGETDRDEDCDLLLGFDVLEDFGKE